MICKQNPTGRGLTVSCYRRPPGSALLQNLLLFSLLLILSPACQVHKNGPDEVQVEEGLEETALYRVSFSADSSSRGYRLNIYRFDLLVFDADGLHSLERRFRLDTLPASLEFKARKGPLIAVALANASCIGGLDAVSRYEEAESLCAEFELEDPYAPLMSGTALLESAAVVLITLTPLMARVVLDEVCNCMTGYRRLEDPVIYLDNTAAFAEVLRTDGFRPSEFIPSARKRPLPFDIGILPQHPRAELFCYPNDAPSSSPGTPATVFVLEATVDGTPCRFPLSLGPVHRGGTVRLHLLVNSPSDFEWSTE